MDRHGLWPRDDGCFGVPKTAGVGRVSAQGVTRQPPHRAAPVGSRCAEPSYGYCLPARKLHSIHEPALLHSSLRVACLRPVKLHTDHEPAISQPSSRAACLRLRKLHTCHEPALSESSLRGASATWQSTSTPVRRHGLPRRCAPRSDGGRASGISETVHGEAAGRGDPCPNTNSLDCRASLAMTIRRAPVHGRYAVCAVANRPLVMTGPAQGRAQPSSLNDCSGARSANLPARFSFMAVTASSTLALLQMAPCSQPICLSASSTEWSRA